MDTPRKDALSMMSTVNSLLLTAKTVGKGAKPARAELVAQYYKPVRETLAHWHVPPDQLDDVANEFSLAMIETDLVSNFDPSEGRFRDFVRGALWNFLRDNRKRLWSRKERPLGEAFDHEAKAVTEDVFDKAWADDVWERACAEIVRCLREKGAVYLCVWQAATFNAVPVPVEKAAAAFKLTVPEYKHVLHDARRIQSRVLLAILGNDLVDRDEAYEVQAYFLRVVTRGNERRGLCLVD